MGDSNLVWDFQTTFLIVFALTNLLIAWSVDISPRNALSFSALPVTAVSDFSNIGEDTVQEYLIPPQNIGKVALLVEESVHLGLHDLESRRAWWGMGVVSTKWATLGPNFHGFYTQMYHDLHCMSALMDAVNFGAEDDDIVAWHYHHCLNWLRQSILCDSDVTLEPPDSLTRNFSTSRSGGTHVCSDWSSVIQHVEDALQSWEEFKNITWS